MADVSKISVNGTTYDVKDTTARTTANGKLSDAPSDGSEYVRKDGAWAVASGGGGGGNIRYFVNQAVNVTNSISECMRITDSSITTETIVLTISISDKSAVQLDYIRWESFDGYIAFYSRVTKATTANVVLSNKLN